DRRVDRHASASRSGPGGFGGARAGALRVVETRPDRRGGAPDPRNARPPPLSQRPVPLPLFHRARRPRPAAGVGRPRVLDRPAPPGPSPLDVVALAGEGPGPAALLLGGRRHRGPRPVALLACLPRRRPPHLVGPLAAPRRPVQVAPLPPT